MNENLLDIGNVPKSSEIIGYLWTGSAGKESTCKVGDLGLIPGLGISFGEGNDYPLPVFWSGEFSPWNHKESDMTE